MVITDARKKVLYNTYGEGGIISAFSAAKAANADLTAKDTLTKEDIDWLQKNKNWDPSMLAEPEPTPVTPTPSTPSSFPSLDPLRSAQPAIIKAIVDGDTVHAVMCETYPCEDVERAGERFRLYHVSTAPLEWKAGASAAAWLSTHIPVGSNVLFVVKGEDPYSRKLVIIYKDAININELMIREGVGRFWDATENLVGTENTSTSSTTGSTELTRVPDATEVIPTTIGTGTTMVKLNFKNTGSVAAKYYLGILLTSPTGLTYTYTGSPTYGKTIQPGASALLSAVVPAQTVIKGAATITAILNKV